MIYERRIIFKQYRLIIGMRLKLTNTNKKGRDEQHYSYSKSPSKQYTAHHMQIVRSKIDHYLGSSYKKLTINKNTSSITNLTSQCRGSKGIMIDLKRTKNVSSNSQYNTISLMNQHKEQCSLISNKDVIQYIHLVYQMYNIKDPFVSHTNDQTQITQSTIQKDKAKMQTCFQEEINSARTTKAYAQNIIEVSDFDIDNEQTTRNTIKRNNKIVITLRSKTATKRENKANPLMNRNSFKHMNNQEQRKQQCPLFRYCFACEEPIYQKNIQRHESKCYQLQIAYSHSFNTILSLLDEKIQRIKGDINKQILSVSPQQITHRYKQLQTSVKKWISVVPGKLLERDSEMHQKQYMKVREKMSCNSNLQLVSRLDWFLRLRDNIFNHNKAAQQKF